MGEYRRCGLGDGCTHCPRARRCGVGRWCLVCDGGRPAGDEEETVTRVARRIQCGGTPVCPASPRRRSAGPLERALHALSVQLVGPFCRCTLLVDASYGRGLAALCGPSLCSRAACRPPRHRSPRQCRTRRDADADATFSCGHARAGSARDLCCRRRRTWALLTQINASSYRRLSVGVLRYLAASTAD